MRSTRPLLAAMAMMWAFGAEAALERAGPVDLTNGGYPAWYQDRTGLGIEFCKPLTQAELNGGWCLILPGDLPTGAVPEVAFTNYSPEHFYWSAQAGSKSQGGGTSLVLALEGAFAGNAPLAGDQVVFGRLRIKIASVPFTGDYKVYTPFGDYDFPGLAAGDRLFFTTDVGFACGTNFDCALASSIGPFLVPSVSSGGAELPPIPDLVKGSGVDPFYDVLVAPTASAGTGKKYLADPARLGPVTGSPLPPFVSPLDGVTYDHNRFRIEITLPDGTKQVMLDEPNFTVQGRVMTGTIPGRVAVTRASYAQTATTTKLDVFANAFPTMQGRLPGTTLLPTITPDLGFYDVPCGINPTTGGLTAPTSSGIAGMPVTYYQMFRNGTDWWGQNAPLLVPPQVCVKDANSRDANGAVVTAYYQADVSDEVAITMANWAPTTGGGTMTIQAASADQLTGPTLVASGFGTLDSTGTLTVSNLAAPPARVTVTSSRGGVAMADVRTGVGMPVPITSPVANADTITILEDCSNVPAVGCAVPPAPVDVLANDTLNGSALDPSTATVALTTMPRLGTVVLNADKTLSYTPNANANGADLVGYTVAVNGIVSPEGYLHITITPVNDLPTAVADSAGVASNKSITLNLLANDTDPDGAADLANAVIASLPAVGVTLTCNNGQAVAIGTVCAGGSVTLLASTQGTYSFTYNAQDSAGALSANAATVTLTSSAAEQIGITKSIYTVAKNRWTVTGTDNVTVGQSLTISYDLSTAPTYKVSGVCTALTAAKNPVIGTATVDNLGNWTYDSVMTSAGLVNPTNTGGNSTGFWCNPPKAVLVTSPLGGSKTSNILAK